MVGVGGGILGAAFSVLNIRIVKLRTRIINAVRPSAAKKFLRMLEPVIIMVSLHTHWLAVGGWRFSAVVASFVARTKLLNVEPG